MRSPAPPKRKPAVSLRKHLGWMILPALLLTLCAFAEDKKPDDKKPDEKKPEEKKTEGLIVVDSKGKENKITGWTIVTGTRRLGWLTPPEKEPEEKPNEKDDPAPKKALPRPVARGPEALAFRDDNSTNFRDGVLTLIPMENLRSIDYDNEEMTAKVKIAAAKPEDDVSLSGTT